MAAHAKLSPSSAFRWTQCAASAAINAAAPRTSNKYAAEGTAAHEVHEWCLSENTDAAAYLGRVIEADGFTFTVDEEMAGAVQESVDSVRSLLLPGSTLMTEVSLGLSPITGEEGGRGTSDVVAFLPRDDGRYTLLIADYKHGAGVAVDAVKNLQLAIYALAAIEQFAILFDVADVIMRIHQPRRSHFDEWAISRTDLRAYAATVKSAARLALVAGPEGMKVPGDWCRWCAAEVSCGKRLELVSESVYNDAKALFGIETPIVQPPDRSKLAVLRHRIDNIRAWCTAVENAVDVALDRGEDVPGWKRVAGKEGNRAWADESIAKATLAQVLPESAMLTEPALKSPAQIEKLLPKEAKPTVAALVTRSPAKPTTVPASDPRPAFVAVSASDFAA